MDVASASVAFIGFAASTIQSIKQVYDFLQAIKDAPRKVRDLLLELRILQGIIEEIRDDKERIHLASTKVLNLLQDALKLVNDRMNELLSQLEKCLPQDGHGRRRRLRLSFNHVLNTDQIAAQLVDLERAKLMLHMAQARLSM